jgi:chromosome segregation ATPase
MILTPSLNFIIIMAAITITGLVIIIRSILSKYKAQIKNFTEQIDDNDIAIATLKQQLSSIKNQNSLLKQKIDTLHYQHRKYLDKLKPEYRKIFNQLISTIDKLDEITMQFHETEDAYDSLLDDNRELEHELHELTTENIQFRDEIALLKNKLLDIERKHHKNNVIDKENSNTPRINLAKSIKNNENDRECTILDAEVITSHNDVEHLTRLRNNNIQEKTEQ